MQYVVAINVEHRMDAQVVLATMANRVIAIAAWIVCVPIVADVMIKLARSLHALVAAKGAAEIVPALTATLAISALAMSALVGLPVGVVVLWRLTRPAFHALLPVRHNPLLRARLARDGGTGVHTFTFADDRLTVGAPDGETSHPWSEFSRVRETPLCFLLMHRRDSNRCNVIPKRDDPSDRALRSLLAARIAG